VENLLEVEDKVIANADLSPVDLAAVAASVPLPEDEAVPSGYQAYLSRLTEKLRISNPFSRSEAAKENAASPPTPPLDPETRQEIAEAIEPESGATAVVLEGGKADVKVSGEKAEEAEKENVLKRGGKAEVSETENVEETGEKAEGAEAESVQKSGETVEEAEVGRENGSVKEGALTVTENASKA